MLRRSLVEESERKKKDGEDKWRGRAKMARLGRGMYCGAVSMQYKYKYMFCPRTCSTTQLVLYLYLYNTAPGHFFCLFTFYGPVRKLPVLDTAHNIKPSLNRTLADREG